MLPLYRPHYAFCSSIHLSVPAALALKSKTKKRRKPTMDVDAFWADNMYANFPFRNKVCKRQKSRRNHAYNLLVVGMLHAESYTRQ